MAVNPRYVTASYTNLRPYRSHIIRLDVESKQIELLSDPNVYPVASSGWHGRHDWTPQSRTFMLRQFRFLGQNARFHYDIVFHLDSFSAGHHVWRYKGYMAGSLHAEIHIWHTDNYTSMPSRSTPGTPGASFGGTQGPSPARQQPTSSEPLSTLRVWQRIPVCSESGSSAVEAQV